MQNYYFWSLLNICYYKFCSFRKQTCRANLTLNFPTLFKMLESMSLLGNRTVSGFLIMYLLAMYNAFTFSYYFNDKTHLIWNYGKILSSTLEQVENTFYVMSLIPDEKITLAKLNFCLMRCLVWCEHLKEIWRTLLKIFC